VETLQRILIQKGYHQSRNWLESAPRGHASTFRPANTGERLELEILPFKETSFAAFFRRAGCNRSRFARCGVDSQSGREIQSASKAQLKARLLMAAAFHAHSTMPSNHWDGKPRSNCWRGSADFISRSWTCIIAPIRNASAHVAVAAKQYPWAMICAIQRNGFSPQELGAFPAELAAMFLKQKSVHGDRHPVPFILHSRPLLSFRCCAE